MSKEYEKLMIEAQRKKMALAQSSMKQLRKLYKDIGNDLVKKVNMSRGFNNAYYNDYLKYVKRQIKELDNKILELAQSNIIAAGQIAASVQRDFFKQLENDFNLDIPKEILNDFFSIPDNVLLKMLNGDMYKDGVKLSNRIWRSGDKMYKDINYIITKGVAMKKPHTEIMKDLEMFLDPSQKKPWSWSKVYPGTGKQVDYNAQRLVRTCINHSFYYSNMEGCQKNPFVEGVKWELSQSHYSRQVERFGEDVCDEYSRKDIGLGNGIFKKNNVPIPHPNCLCYQTAWINKSYKQIGEELGSWLNGGNNNKLDNWYRNVA